ncbi:MAG: hypothetical protein AB7P49_14040, partial [Bdellovibrionales bacterium]
HAERKSTEASSGKAKRFKLIKDSYWKQKAAPVFSEMTQSSQEEERNSQLKMVRVQAGAL